MGVVLTVDGTEYLNQAGYSVTEDSTPLDPSDSSGGVGQFTVGISEEDVATNPRFLRKKTATLVDGSQGTTTGVVRGVSGANGDLTLTVNSRMAQLAVQRTAAPFVGTLEDAFTYYLSLVDITSGLVVDDSIADRPVTFIGWVGNVWDYMKKMAAAEQVEVSLVSNNVVLRPLRERIAENYRNSSVNWGADEGQLARSVEVYYYEGGYDASGLAYPTGGWGEDVPIFTVNANETQEFNIPLSVSLMSIDQPTCVDWVDRYHESSSVYAVSGNDGLVVPNAQWIAEGGSVTVAINEDTRSITVTVVGSSNAEYSPYRIAMPSGTSDFYSSLRLVGEGVFYEKKLLTLYTGVDHDDVTEEVGVTVDNEFITTLEAAYHCGLWTLKRYGGPRNTINVTTNGVNRIGETGSYTYPTIDQINPTLGATVADVNTAWTGMTVADVNALWAAITADGFENQAFGNIAGARVRHEDAWFRVRTATNEPEGISYTAEDDTVISDFSDIWAPVYLSEPIENRVKNPSPQLAITGFTGGNIETPARVAGIGVAGGYGALGRAESNQPSNLVYIENGRDGVADIPVTPGDIRTFSAYVTADKIREIYLSVIYWSAANAYIGESSSVALGAGTTITTAFGFVRCSVTVTIPPGAHHATVRARGTIGSTAWAGPRKNLLINPSGRVDTTGWFALGTGASLVSEVGDTYSLTTTGGISAGSFGLYTSVVVGVGDGNLKPNTQYVFSSDLGFYIAPSGTDSPHILYVAGTGVDVVGYSSFAAHSGFQRHSVTFTTGASGDATLYMLNGVDTGGGGINVVYFRDAICEEVDTWDSLNPYFDGSTVDTVYYDYAWSGAANNSYSTRTGDVIVLDRVSDAAGDYFDGSTRPAGYLSEWTGSAYGSTALLLGTIPTVADFNAEWAGLTIDETKVAMLRRTA